MHPKYVIKAIVAAVVAAGGTLTTGLADGSLDSTEWIAVVVSTVVALGAVYQIPNATPTHEPTPADIDDGQPSPDLTDDDYAELDALVVDVDPDDITTDFDEENDQ